METETIDKLFLELSQVTTARTAREVECEKYHELRIAELERLLSESRRQNEELLIVLDDIETCRGNEGDTVTILCDNPDAEDEIKQSAVELIGDFTGYETMRVYGKNWKDALHAAAERLRNLSDEPSDC